VAFEQQVEFLSRYFSVIPLSELVQRWRRGKSIAKCASLTFDDAYAGVLSLGDAVLRKYSLPATMFVASEASSGAKPFWWDIVHSLALSDQSALFDLLLQNRLPQQIALSGDLELVRQWVLSERGGILDIAAAVSRDTTVLPRHVRAMTEEELRRLCADGRWTLAGHTAAHPALPQLPAQAQAVEIRGGSEWLTQRFEKVLPFVAYPYGLLANSTIDAARSCGMTAGFTMDPRPPMPSDLALALPRVGLSQHTERRRVPLRLSRIVQPLLGKWDARSSRR
jgi:peptidoglycan/xylan/chitin deacetylase (PgdA/CDA1 family)